MARKKKNKVRRRLYPARTYKVEFTGYTDDGFASGKGPCGYEIRAMGAVRGETALVRLEHVSPHRPLGWGRIEKLLDTAEERRKPACVRAATCGGCSWMHLSYETQLAEKSGRLREIAGRLRPMTAPHKESLRASCEVAASPRTLRYRNRGKYVLAKKRGKVVVGAYRPRTHRVISTLGCPVVETPVDITARVLAQLLTRTDLPIYDEKTRHGVLRYAGVRANDRGEVLATLVTRTEGPESIRLFARDLRNQCPGLVGVTQDINPASGNVLFSGDARPLWGKPVLEEGFGPARVRLQGHSFLQVNRTQAARLYEHVAETVSPSGSSAPGVTPPTVWELFCGTGAISLLLARRGVRVTGVELDPVSVQMATEAAQAAGLRELCRFTSSDAGEWLEARAASERPPGAIVVNPPRSGCSPEVISAVAALRPCRLVYVSCNPDTLVRDLERLAPSGFELFDLRGFDMMPHTPHLETVAVMERAGGS
jgi:23S rRNA (uracil1939-C5)-methyltransferase